MFNVILQLAYCCLGVCLPFPRVTTTMFSRRKWFHNLRNQQQLSRFSLFRVEGLFLQPLFCANVKESDWENFTEREADSTDGYIEALPPKIC